MLFLLQVGFLQDQNYPPDWSSSPTKLSAVMEALAQRILEAACGLACRAGKVAECATASCRNQHTCLQTLKHNMTQQATEHGIEATAWSCSSRGSCCTSPPSTASASFRLLAKHSASFGVGARHVRDEVSRFGLPNNELQSDVVGMLSVSLEFHYTGTLSPLPDSTV